MRAETLTWVGGEHDFALPLPLLEALQTRCGGDGVGLIHNRLATGMFKVQDVLSTLALGLEGGGMAKQAAVSLTRALYEDHGLHALAIPAFTILGLAMSGWPSQTDDGPSGEAGVETPKTS